MRRLSAVMLLLSSMSTWADTFTVTSPDIAEGQRLAKTFEFKGFGCDGDNLSPTLAWKNAPAGTKSFAITVYDPDAPTGSGWWHWQVVNIPANVQSVARGANMNPDALPKTVVQTRTDYGSARFGGACPPVGHGMHRYQFTVWALSTDHLALDENASGALTGYMLNANALAKSTITAIYSR